MSRPISQPCISNDIERFESSTSTASQTHRQSQNVSELTNLVGTEGISLSRERQETLQIDKTPPREKKPLWLTRVVAIYDGLLLVTSVVFLLLGVSSKYLDGKPVASNESLGNFILLATKWVRNPSSDTNDSYRGLLFGISSLRSSLPAQSALLRHG